MNDKEKLNEVDQKIVELRKKLEIVDIVRNYHYDKGYYDKIMSEYLELNASKFKLEDSVKREEWQKEFEAKRAELYERKKQLTQKTLKLLNYSNKELEEFIDKEIIEETLRLILSKTPDKVLVFKVLKKVYNDLEQFKGWT